MVCYEPGCNGVSIAGYGRIKSRIHRAIESLCRAIMKAKSHVRYDFNANSGEDHLPFGALV